MSSIKDKPTQRDNSELNSLIKNFKRLLNISKVNDSNLIGF